MFHRIICDESHKLKSMKILVHILVSRLRTRMGPRASKVIFLTGSPMANRGMTLAGQLDFLQPLQECILEPFPTVLRLLADTAVATWASEAASHRKDHGVRFPDHLERIR